MSNTSSYGTHTNGGLMQTAKLGTIGLISSALGFLLSFTGFPLSGLLGLAGLVLGIVSLVKKERPVWPAWVAIVLALSGVILLTVLIILGAALIGLAS